MLMVDRVEIRLTIEDDDFEREEKSNEELNEIQVELLLDD